MRWHQISIFLILISTIFLWSAPARPAADEESHVLFERCHLYASSPTRATLQVHRRIWINDERSKTFGGDEMYTNEFSKIKTVKAWIEDEDGKRIKELEKDDLVEGFISEGNVLYSGKGRTFFLLQHHTLPYFVEYRYEIELRSLLFWPDWYPQRSIPVRQAVFDVTMRKGLGYHTMTIGPAEEIEAEEGRRWMFTDIPAAPRRYMCPPEDEVRYGVCFSPDDLVLDDVHGRGDSWEEIGRWFHRLCQGQYGLEPGTRMAFDPADSLTQSSLVQGIYAYVQDAIRYVAIQPGVHGWKPHKAQTVHDCKYGDCKDLTTYFITLLEQQGVHACPGLLRTRETGAIEKNFPTLDFNHVIAYVPLSAETLWIDCTEDHTTIRDLPPHDEGCAILVIEDGVGRLMQTPVSEAEENLVVFTADASVRRNKNLELVGSLEATGNEAQIIRRLIQSAAAEDRQRICTGWLGAHAPEIELEELRFVNLEDPSVALRIEFRGIAKKYGNSSSKRFYFQPSFFRRVTFTGEEPAGRQTAVFCPYPKIYTDRITYRLPEHFVPEVLPESTQLKEPFGEYEYIIEANEGYLTFSRTFRIDRQRIELDEYAAFYEFMEKIEDLDAARAVFVKK